MLEDNTNITKDMKLDSQSKKGTNVSKLLVLLTLVSLILSCYIVYQTQFGKHNFQAQDSIIKQQSKQINDLLATVNLQQAKLIGLESKTIEINQQLQQLNPSQASLIMNQLNSLISGANQSLLVYHDYVAAIQQLKYAQNILITTNDPRFSLIKVNLTKDLDNLEIQNDFDSTMVATQLDEFNKLIAQLQLVSPVTNNSLIENSDSIFMKLLKNLKNSVLSLVKINRINVNNSQGNQFNSDIVLRQHLQVNVLNAKQALLTHNQELWTNSIEDSKNLIGQYFINDMPRQKVLLLLTQLSATKFNDNIANLQLTLSALNKLELLTDWKQ